MKYGFVFPGGDARDAANMAHAAETAGWDGFFVPDAPWWFNPWVTLTAVALATDRLSLGTMITPVSRRKPWELASETATLDRLSNGRLILSVGLGALDTGFKEFGEETDTRIRAQLLDEGLAIITRLWQGQSIAFSGKHYRLKKIKGFPPCPAPVQSPRIPIWVVGAWPREKSMRRALRYDGLLPNKLDEEGKQAQVTPDDIRAMKLFVDENRAERTPFDIVVEGQAPGKDRKKAVAHVEPWLQAGATWWLESMWDSGGDMEKVQARIKQGPPQG